MPGVICDIVSEKKGGEITENGDFLDTIIDNVLGSSDESPKFVRDCEKNVIKEIHSYTDRVRKAGEKLDTDKDVVGFAEENAEGLLDSVCVSNRIYMKTGLKLGAKLVFQLLGI